MCRPAAVRLPAAPTSSCNFPPSSGQNQAGGVQRLRAALKSRQNRIPAMPCNAPSHSLNIAHSKQPLARYLHAKLATAANARPRQHPEINSQRASRKSVGAGKGQGCWHCRRRHSQKVSAHQQASSTAPANRSSFKLQLPARFWAEPSWWGPAALRVAQAKAT